MTSSQREAIEIMKRMDTVTVIPALVAQALGMNPDVLRKHARDGEYKISAYEVTGNTVRFFRKDFLQKIGEIEPDKPEKTTAQVLEEISDSMTEQERLAILATHTGNTSFFSFAAEVQFHAKFLTWWAKIPIPGGSPYASAIRADMSIGDAEFEGPTPYYRPDSRIVRKQYHCHKDNV